MPDAQTPEVIVVDDDPDIRTALSVALESHGFRVSAFNDGQTVLDSVTRVPSLILLDYMMPRLNAEGFLHARSAHALLKDVPVVVISAYPDLAQIVAERTVGVLHKPIDLEILLECVRYHCGRDRSTS
jgi:DNA-binding response OmpR family regulator